MKVNKKTKGNLLLIFLFTSGLLGILVTGIYFLITGSAVQQSFVETQAARRKVEKGLDEVYKSELERLVKDYISNSLSQTLVASFTSSPYQTALASAVNWAFDTATLKEAAAGNPGSLSVTMPDQVTYPVAAKANTPSSNTNFREHPLSLMPGYDAEMTLSGTFTPTWSDKPFTYSRKMVAYREIPACYIPFSAAYATGNLTSKWETLSLSGGPVALFGGDTNHANAVVANSFSALSSAPNLPNLVSTYGVLPENICSTTNSGNAGAQQQYRRDASVRVITFNGSVVAPSTTGFAAASVDGKTRCVITTSTAGFTTTYTKFFINCTNAAGMQNGIVVKDITSGTGPSASCSIATNGPVMLWQYKSSTKTPIVVATNYGIVSLADSTYTGSGTPPNPLDFAFSGYISSYGKPTSIFYDVFGRSGALGGSTPTYSADSLTWTAGAGDQTCNSGNVTATTANSWVVSQIGVIAGQGYVKGPLGCFVTTTSFGNSKNLSVIFSSSAAWDTTVNQYELKVAMSAGGAPTVSLNPISGGSATADATSATPSYSAGTHIWGFIHSPSSNEVFITLDGALVLKKKLTVPLASVPNYVVWKMDSGITVTRFEAMTSPFGTLITSPQTRIAGTDTATIYGGMAIGQGWVSSLDSGATLNFTYKSTVADALKALCERVIVHYPYFYKP